MDQIGWRDFGALFALLVGVWVMIDATKRGIGGLGAFLWGLGTFLLLCIGLPMWLLMRPAVPGETYPGRVGPPKRLRSQMKAVDPNVCPACGGRLTPEDFVCPSCGINFGRPVADEGPPQA